MGPFHTRQKHIILCDSKQSSFHHIFFELQFDTATLIIPSVRMISRLEVANRGSNLIYHVRFLFAILLYSTINSITRPIAAVLMT